MQQKMIGKNYGKWLDCRIKAKGLTPSKFATYSGVDYPRVKAYLDGDYLPGMRTFFTICDFFGDKPDKVIKEIEKDYISWTESY